MNEFFWNVFKKSGDINAFMAYKEYERCREQGDGYNKSSWDSDTGK